MEQVELEHFAPSSFVASSLDALEAFDPFAAWLGFSPTLARLKNPNAEQKRSRSLAYGICEASKASFHKLAKGRGCFEGSIQYTLSCEKTTPKQIPIES